MSKFVKNLQIKQFKNQFEKVSDLLVVNVMGVEALTNNQMRLELRKKGVLMQVVPNNLARHVFKDLGMTPVGEMLDGPSAIAWGGSGIVELAKEISGWAKKIEKFTIKGGYVAGQKIGADGVETLTKLPSKEQLIGEIIGMLLGPIQGVVSALNAPGAQVASQISEIGEGKVAKAG